MSSVSYRKPPVEQAILEIRWQDSIKESLLKKAVRKLSNDYPLDQDEIKIDVSIQGETAKVGQKIDGHRLLSKDDLGALLVRPKSLTFCRFAPYEGWDIFQAEAESTWKKIKKTIKRQKLLRLGLRYINRIDIPIPDEEKMGVYEEGDYLNVRIKSPKNMPTMESYFTHFSFKLDKGIRASIRSGTVESPIMAHNALKLDLDVFIENDVPQSEQNVWLMFDKLRKQKNDLFEKYITDKSRDIFMGKDG